MPKRDASYIPPEDRIVTDKLKFDVICGICCSILEHPRQCLSGHIYCGNCVAKCIAKNIPCPSCRREMTEATVARNLFLEEYCKEFIVYCQYRYKKIDENNTDIIEDDKGCKEEIPFELLEKHEKECRYSWIRCPFTYKSEIVHNVRKLNWDTHKSQCEYRPSICKHCDNCYPYETLINHEDNCPERVVTCLQCNETLLRKNLYKHKKELCEKELIDCNFKEHGCNIKVIRKELQNHLEENQVSHLTQLQMHHDKQLKDQKTLYENYISNLKNEISKLETQLMAKSESQIITRWNVKNFSSIKKRCYKRSKPFSIENVEWFLGAYFFGDCDESKEYLSIYLFCQNMQKNKNITLKYSISLVNHISEDKSVSKDFTITFPVSNGQGWGDRKAIKHNEILETNGFLHNDTISIVCKIQVCSVQWNVLEL